MSRPKLDPIERTTIGSWKARFVPATKPVAWSSASRLTITRQDWEREWTRLEQAIAGDTLEVLKRDRSGDVIATTISLAGWPVDVVLKRPREKSGIGHWFRQSKARRAWDKALTLRAISVPVEPPLALFERAGEAVAIYERVPGPTLEKVNLEEFDAGARRTLFLRCGRLLRRIESRRLAHTDAKSSNWIIFDDPKMGPRPVLIDAYGIRWLNPWLGLFGLHRLLRAMKNHTQYTPADSLAICQGFAPHAEFTVESAEESEEGQADAH